MSEPNHFDDGLEEDADNGTKSTSTKSTSECDTRSELSFEMSEDHFSINDNDDDNNEIILSSKSQLETAIAKHIKLLRIQSDDEELKRKLVIKICELRIKLNQMNESNEQLYVCGHRLEKCDHMKIGTSLTCDQCLKKTKLGLKILSGKKNGNTIMMCQFCGFTVHQKCQNTVTRNCPRILFEENESNNYGVILKICPEIGLSAQQFQCAECNTLISLDNSRVCDYNGLYYCFICHWGDVDSVIIPARVIHNWDFVPRPVSRISMQIINYIKQKPILFNITELNPMLYGLVDELGHLKKFRSELSQMIQYIRRCKQPNRPRLCLNHYLVNDEALSSYSLNDLNNLTILMKSLTEAHQNLMTHITKDCEGCRGNGFFCELCRDKDDVLFPFLANCANCSICNAVYHKNCYHRKNKKCPRCERIKVKQLQEHDQLKNNSEDTVIDNL